MSYLNKHYLFQICKYLVIALSLGSVRCELQSPCPNVFEYRYDGAYNTYGFVQVPVPGDVNVVRLEVQLSVGNSVQGFSGNIELATPRVNVIEDLDDNKPLQYNIYFPYWINNPPKITRILVNGNQVCFGYPFDKSLVQILTTIHLEHTLTISVPLNSTPLRRRRPPPPDPNRGNSLPQANDQFVSEPKNEKPYNDFNFQSRKNSESPFPYNPFLNQNNKFNYNLFSNNQDSKISPRPQNDYQYEFSRPYYNDFSRLPNTNRNPSTRNELTSENSPNNGYPLSPDSYTPNNNQNAQNDDLPFIPNNFPPNGNFNFNNNGVSIPQSWFTTTTTPSPPPSPPLPSTTTTARATTTTTTTRRPFVVTQVPRDAVVDDLPTVENNLVQKPFSNVCGTTVKTNALLVNGNHIARGVQPWLAALFMQNSEGLQFICGTSLISQKHVVTAAHCVRNRKRRLKPDELWVVLGRENIQRWSNDGAQIIQADTTHIHPDYQYYTADADIAVIVLSEDATFTVYVRPVCLWTGNTDINLIVTQTGTVVGWGKDEDGQSSTPEPKQITFPVVSDYDCLTANQAFRDITSNRTFCGGYRNNSGPCNGDSGSGFVMEINGLWTLRGLVSMSLLRPDGNCDLEQYIVFTDVAKHIDWILSYLT